MALERVVLQVPKEEFERWSEEAAQRRMSVEAWAKHIVSWSFAANVQGLGSTFTTAGRRLVREAFYCAWCGQHMSVATTRKMYCTDRCRVAAHRARRAEERS